MKVTSLKDLKTRSQFLQLHHPLDENDKYFGPDEKPLGLEIVGFESQKMRDALLDAQRAAMSATLEQLGDPSYKVNNDLKLMSSAIVGWSHSDIFGEYSPEKALELIADGDNSWIVKQIEAFIVERKHFFAN